MLDVEDHVEEQRMMPSIKSSLYQKALAHGSSEKKRLEDEMTKTKDVEDPVAKVSAEEQMKQITMEKDLAHDFEDGNLKLVGDDDEGEALKLLFEDEEDKKAKELAKLFFYLSTAEEEWTGGVGGDPFGANCWFD
ncbi:Uncharacterized protein Rs2_02696 [Raphanus sativus]|nr:Uncharacterized protein Rs2_02696 [Raphanus sativus]